MSTIWFTSDTHFGHRGILGYCDRPFGSIEEHDAALIANINALVKPGDRVFHLGDFAFGRDARVREIFEQLRGQWVVVLGNHDHKNWAQKFRAPFPRCLVAVKDYHELKVDGQKLVLSHYPFATWNGAHYGSFMLHGHSHGDFAYSFPRSLSCRRADVGVDVWDYRPVAYETLRDKLLAAPFTRHHDRAED